jgi:hypothetical protein
MDGFTELFTELFKELSKESFEQLSHRNYFGANHRALGLLFTELFKELYTSHRPLAEHFPFDHLCFEDPSHREV